MHSWCFLSNSHMLMLLAMQFVVIKYLVNQVLLLFILTSIKQLLSMYLVDPIDIFSFYSNCDWKWTEFPNFQLNFTWFQMFLFIYFNSFSLLMESDRLLSNSQFSILLATQLVAIKLPYKPTSNPLANVSLLNYQSGIHYPTLRNLHCTVLSWVNINIIDTNVSQRRLIKTNDFCPHK